MLKTGITGFLITLVCCFTPVLVIFLSAIGLVAVVSWLDFLLFPMLAVFLGMIVVALRRKGKFGDTNGLQEK